MLKISLTPKEVHILVQALRLAEEGGDLKEYAKRYEIDQLNLKLNNVR